MAKSTLNSNRGVAIFLTERKNQCLLCFFLTSLLSINCTESSLFGSHEISYNAISGKVALDSGLSLDQIYVWLAALNLSTRTDENGEFSLEIPPPSAQPGVAINGIFDLYFYAANYRLKSVQIAFNQGKAIFSKLSLDEKGELNQTIVLSEILNIDASIDPDNLSEAGRQIDLAHFYVQAANEPLTVLSNFSVQAFNGDPEYMAGFLLDSDSRFVKFLRKEDRGARTTYIQVGKSGVSLRPVILTIDPGELSPGQYEVVPYLVVYQDLPNGLLRSIGENAQNYGFDFLKIPMKVKNNRIQYE